MTKIKTYSVTYLCRNMDKILKDVVSSGIEVEIKSQSPDKDKLDSSVVIMSESKYEHLQNLANSEKD